MNVLYTSGNMVRRIDPSCKTLGESPKGFPIGKYGPGCGVSCVGGWDRALTFPGYMSRSGAGCVSSVVHRSCVSVYF